MVAPVIPGLTDHEIMNVVEAVTNAGAKNAGYTTVRLNGDIGQIFTDWVKKMYQDRAEKILNRIRDTHAGQLNDSRWGTRMKGEGKYAEIIGKQFELAKKKYMPGAAPYEFDLTLYERSKQAQTSLFDLIS